MSLVSAGSSTSKASTKKRSVFAALDAEPSAAAPRGKRERHIGAARRSQTGCVGYEVRKAGNGDIPGIEAAYFCSWRAAYEDFLEPEALNDQAQRRRRSFDWSCGMKDRTRQSS